MSAGGATRRPGPTQRAGPSPTARPRPATERSGSVRPTTRTRRSAGSSPSASPSPTTSGARPGPTSGPGSRPPRSTRSATPPGPSRRWPSAWPRTPSTASSASSPRRGASGRSFHDGREPGPEGRDGSGRNFAEQWRRALELDPKVIFVTNWNEWVAGRYTTANMPLRGAGPVTFVDEFDAEFSRDIEPMVGGHGDNYYYQMVANIRRFKGARPIPAVVAGPIAVDGRFDDWAGVGPEFRDTVGDPAPSRSPRLGRRELATSKRDGPQRPRRREGQPGRRRGRLLRPGGRPDRGRPDAVPRPRRRPEDGLAWLRCRGEPGGRRGRAVCGRAERGRAQRVGPGRRGRPGDRRPASWS